MSSLPGELTIVLDDYHMIDSKAVHATGHWPMFSRPEDLAELLLELPSDAPAQDDAPGFKWPAYLIRLTEHAHGTLNACRASHPGVAKQESASTGRMAELPSGGPCRGESHPRSEGELSAAHLLREHQREGSTGTSFARGPYIVATNDEWPFEEVTTLCVARATIDALNEL